MALIQGLLIFWGYRMMTRTCNAKYRVQKNEDIEEALAAFRQKCKAAGLRNDIRRQVYFVSKSASRHAARRKVKRGGISW